MQKTFLEVKIWKAVRSSTAAPFYFHSFIHDGRKYVEGGLKCNNPTNVLFNEHIVYMTGVNADIFPLFAGARR